MAADGVEEVLGAPEEVWTKCMMPHCPRVSTGRFLGKKPESLTRYGRLGILCSVVVLIL